MRISMKLVTLLAVVGLSAWPLLSMAEPDEKSDYYSASESDNRQDGEKPGKEPCDKKAAAALGDEPCDKKGESDDEKPCDKEKKSAAED
ncbi:MAG: hypothetical protein L3J62_04270 [Gammaproteobacteria bacterium]|nr:hypothetical protein [Gammaproteobacteria bacterium]